MNLTNKFDLQADESVHRDRGLLCVLQQPSNPSAANSVSSVPSLPPMWVNL